MVWPYKFRGFNISIGNKITYEFDFQYFSKNLSEFSNIDIGSKKGSSDLANKGWKSYLKVEFFSDYLQKLYGIHVGLFKKHFQFCGTNIQQKLLLFLYIIGQCTLHLYGLQIFSSYDYWPKIQITIQYKYMIKTYFFFRKWSY